MDLRAMLNNDLPANSPATSPPLRPPVQQPQPRRPAQPPPLQSPYPPSGPCRYGPPPPQHSYHQHASPTTSKGYPFPAVSPQFPQQLTGPSQSPHSQHHQQQQPPQQAYVSSPVGTPHGTPHTSHPLSAHSNTPTSAVSSSPHSQFPPPGQPHHYGGPLQQQQQPQSPLTHYPGSQHQQHGYPRPSPIASPIEGRSGFIAPSNDRVIPALGIPAPRERERERSVQRQRERDISISPKTKVPYLPDADEDFSPVAKKEPGYGDTSIAPGGMTRPTSQHQQHQSPLPPPPPPPSQQQRQQQRQQQQMPDYSRASAMGQDRHRDAMDVDHTPEERKWNSPVSDRIKLNGSGHERRDDNVQGHLAQRHSPSNNASQHSQQMSPPPKDQLIPPQPQRPASAAPTKQPSAPPSPKSQSQQQPQRPPPTPTQSQNHQSDGQRSSPGSSGPPRKRPRGGEAPIWARKASRSSSSSPVMASRRQPPTSSHPPSQAPQHLLQAAPHPSIPLPPPHATAQQQSQQPRPPPTPGPLPLNASDHKFLPGYGPWEPSIINSEPYEEVSRQVADFLFHNVVLQTDPALVSGGPDGPIIEIEAKIGHLVDKNTNDRLALPIRSETVFNHNDPGFRVQFRSSMSDVQHKQINNYLNKVLMDSKRNATQEPPEAARIPLDYVHTRERDSFYELPADKYYILPPTIRDTLNPRHKTRVRVTTDQKTGRVLKKIIKARIADMNVLSPSTAFDWRVSVNMEMPYTGDHEKLHPLGGGPGDGDRNKDRLSYRHLIYQIDLTQVTDKNTKKEHELEVEVDGEEIRKQGLMARDKRPNSYEQLVKGFVDNVRVLIRAISSVER